MAVQTTATAQGIKRLTGNVPANSDYSCIFQFYIPAIPGPGRWRTFFFTCDDPATYTHYIWIGQEPEGGVSFFVGGAGDNFIYGQGHSWEGDDPWMVGWHTGFYVREGSVHRLYIDGVLDITGFEHSPDDPPDAEDSVVTLNISGWTIAQTFIGTDTYDIDWGAGKYQYFREWNKAKTLNDLIAETNSPVAIDTVGLWSDVPLVSNLNDISGNGRHFSLHGSPSIINGPRPVPISNTNPSDFIEGPFFVPVVGSLDASAALEMSPSNGRDQIIQLLHLHNTNHSYTTTRYTWYKYIPSPGEHVVGWGGYAGERIYYPNGFMYHGAGAALTYVPPYGGGMPLGSQALPNILNRNFEFGVDEDKTQYNLLLQSVSVLSPFDPPLNDYYVPALVVITIDLAPDPPATLPDGTIMVLSEFAQYPFPTTLIDGETGAILGMKYPFNVHAQAADVLPGRLFSETQHNNKLALYDHSFNLIKVVEPYAASSTTTGTPVRFPMRTNNAMARFYVINYHTDPSQTALVWYDADGNLGPDVWMLDIARVTAIAVSNDGSTLYYCGGGSGPGSGTEATKVRRYDLNAHADLPDLAPGPTVPDPNIFIVADILVQADDTIIVCYSGIVSFVLARVFCVRYSSDGTVLNTYEFTWNHYNRDPFFEIVPARMAYSIDNPSTFWIWLHTDPLGLGDVKFIEVRVSDGVYVKEHVVPDFNFAQHRGGDTEFRHLHQDEPFGPVVSCPLVILRSGAAPNFIDLDIGQVPIPADICVRLHRRLGDPDRRVWSAEEIDLYLEQGMRELCTRVKVIWDWVYVENLPRGFSFTSAFEGKRLSLGLDAPAIFKYGPGDGMGEGLGDYTMPDERRYSVSYVPGRVDEDWRNGFANHTCPDELDWLVEARASTDIPPVANLPHRLTEIERSLWDQRKIDPTSHHFRERGDSRYEIHEGEVYGYTWRKDGPRAFRKIRVPATVAEYYDPDGHWGIVRTPTDLTDDVVQGDWGIPRIIASHHPHGPTQTGKYWGTPRRFYKDDNNVRVEHWRIAYIDCIEAELPPRYVRYLEDYGMMRALSRQGPGQDLKLAQYYKTRWERDVARVLDRVDRTRKERVGRMGGAAGEPRSGPPRPSLPWQYGKTVR